MQYEPFTNLGLHRQSVVTFSIGLKFSLFLCQVLVCLYEPWFLENKNRKSEACRNDFLGDFDQVSATCLSKKLLKDFFVSQILREQAIEIPFLFFTLFFGGGII